MLFFTFLPWRMQICMLLFWKIVQYIARPFPLLTLYQILVSETAIFIAPLEFDLSERNEVITVGNYSCYFKKNENLVMETTPNTTAHDHN